VRDASEQNHESDYAAAKAREHKQSVNQRTANQRGLVLERITNRARKIFESKTGTLKMNSRCFFCNCSILMTQVAAQRTNWNFAGRELSTFLAEHRTAHATHIFGICFSMVVASRTTR